MYEDNRYQIKINWKKILLIVGIIALVIIIIMLLMPKTNSNAYYTTVFNSNLNEMKSAAKSYYESEDNLPKSIGDTSTISLENMVSKKLVTEFVDKDNNSCNKTDSYAQIKKTGTNTYVLKTQLSCDDKSDYVLETISTSTTVAQADANNDNNTTNNQDNNTTNSTDNNTTDSESNNNSGNTINNSEDDDEDNLGDNVERDKDGNIVKKVTEYEYKKPIYNSTTVYRCEDGTYTLVGTKCYKTITGEPIKATPIYFDDVTTTTDAKKNTTGGYDEKTDATKSVDKTESKCPDGYTENGDTCVKYVEATVIPGTTTYTCSDTSFTYNETTKKCEKKVAATAKTSTKTEYTCVNGSDTLSGTSCTYAATTNTSSNESCSCPSGYSEYGSSCRKATTSSETCSCPSGYSEYGNTCRKYVTSSQTCSCPSGYSEYGNTCRKYVTSSQTCSCPSGYSEYGNRCRKATTTSGSCSCPSGYEEYGGRCRKSSTSCSYSSPTYDNGKNIGTYSYDKSGGNISCSKKTISGYTYYECTEYELTCSQGTLVNDKCQVCSGSGYEYTSKTCSSGSTSYEYTNKTCSGGGSYYDYTSKTCSGGGSYYDYTSKTCSGGGTTYTYASKTCNSNTTTSNTCDNRSGKNPSLNYSKTTCSYPANKETKTETTYTCESGYTLDSSTNTCVKTMDATKVETSTQYTCPSGYTQEGSTCYTTTNKETTTTYKYTCPEGYTADGTGESTTCTKHIESTEEWYCEDKDAVLDKDKKTCTKTTKGGIKGYECPSDDYILNGEYCTLKTCDSKDAIADTEETVTYQYKWSTEESIEGWTKTGNTREKTVESTELIK